MTRIYVPQPIPEVAASKLNKLGEVTTYPHVDRMIPESELLEAVRDKHILFKRVCKHRTFANKLVCKYVS